MANKKISDLTDAGTSASTDYYEVEQASGSRKQSRAAMRTAMAPSYAKISDTKTQNTNGGTATSGTWEVRDLQTEDQDPDSIVSISSNRFTLQAGTYYIKAKAPGYSVDTHRIKLYNYTDTSDVIIGDNSQSAGSAQTNAELEGKFTISSAKEFEIRHRVVTTYATIGHGIASNFTTEVYTVVEIWKL